MTNINYSYSVLTPAASGADVIKTGNIMSITGAPSVDVRRIVDNIYSSRVDPLIETVDSWTITAPASPTSAAYYAFGAVQTVGGINPPNQLIPGTNLVQVTTHQQISNQVAHTVASGGETQTVLGDFLNDGLTTLLDPALGFRFTNSATTGVITVTALAGSPLLSFTDRSISPGALVIARAAGFTTNIVSSTNATPIVVTTAAGTYAVGETVTIAGHATNTAANGTWLVSATNGTTTLTLQGSVGNGVGGATGTAVIQAQPARGSVSQLTSAGVASSLLTSGHIYGTFAYNFYATVEGGTRTSEPLYTHVIYVDQTASGANYTNFRSAFATAVGATWV